MTLDALLDQLTAAGVALSVDGDRLLFDAPAGAMTPDLRAGIAGHRAELIRRLTAPPFPPDYFARWVCRPDAQGRLGWEAPDLPDDSRWWARRRFEELPQWLPALPMPPACLTTNRKAGVS